MLTALARWQQGVISSPNEWMNEHITSAAVHLTSQWQLVVHVVHSMRNQRYYTKSLGCGYPQTFQKKNLAGQIWIRQGVGGCHPARCRSITDSTTAEKEEEEKRKERKQLLGWKEAKLSRPSATSINTHTRTHMSCLDGKKGLVQICCHAVLHNHNSVTRGALGGA